MKYIKFYIVVLGCCLMNLSWSQETLYKDSVAMDELYLNDGSIFRGKILKYRTNNTIKVELWNGAIAKFSGKQISKIIQTTAPRSLVASNKEKSQPTFKKDGFYTTLYAGGLSGSTPWSSEYILGATFNGAYGYQFKGKYSVSLGTGIDYYYINQREMVLPIFLETRYLIKSQASLRPFFSLSGGYGFGIKDETWRMIKAEGGWMVHPAFGVQFGNAKSYNWTLDAGVRLQRATFTFDSTPSWQNADSESFEHRMNFRRLAIRLGMMF